MKTIKVSYRQPRPWKWNSDKQIDVEVDGQKQIWYLYNMSLEKAYKAAKKYLGIKRAKRIA